MARRILETMAPHPSSTEPMGVYAKATVGRELGVRWRQGAKQARNKRASNPKSKEGKEVALSLVERGGKVPRTMYRTCLPKLRRCSRSS